MTQEDIEMEEMMRSMEGMEGMGDLDMFSREELMSKYGLLDYDDAFDEYEGAISARSLLGLMSWFLPLVPTPYLQQVSDDALRCGCHQDCFSSGRRTGSFWKIRPGMDRSGVISLIPVLDSQAKSVQSFHRLSGWWEQRPESR